MTKQDDALDHIHALMSHFKSHMHQAMRGCESSGDPEGISMMEARALGFFSRHPASTSTDLVAHSRRDKAQIARLVKSLVERGLIEGRPDERDGRVVRFEVTAEGKSVQKTMQQHRKKFGDRLTAGLTASEREQLGALLGKIRKELEHKD